MNPTTSITRQLAAIYECPDCEIRYVDERRCPDCNLFCRRVGTGGTCPHCDEPIAVTDLEQKPIMPITSPSRSAGGRHWADPMATTGQIS